MLGDSAFGEPRSLSDLFDAWKSAFTFGIHVTQDPMKYMASGRGGRAVLARERFTPLPTINIDRHFDLTTPSANSIAFRVRRRRPQ
jgi:hypothetical protein